MTGIEIKTEDYYCIIYNHSTEDSFDFLPWGDEPFDVIIVCSEGFVLNETLKNNIHNLILKNSEWFEVLGPNSEYLHDYIDNASVRFGRQAKAGDGSPMTTWHEGIQNPKDIVDSILSSILGGNDNRIILIAGDNDIKPQFIDILEKLASTKQSEVDDSNN